MHAYLVRSSAYEEEDTFFKYLNALTNLIDRMVSSFAKDFFPNLLSVDDVGSFHESKLFMLWTDTSTTTAQYLEAASNEAQQTAEEVGRLGGLRKSDASRAPVRLAHGRCMLRCPAFHYADINRVCQPCASTCKSCSGPLITQCTSCESNPCATRGGCPDTLFPLLDTGRTGGETGRCVSRCAPGFYAGKDGLCAKCDAACRECSGPRRSQCKDPTGGAFLHTDCAPGAWRRGKSCVLACPIGHYRLSDGECAACENYDCEQCAADDPTKCLSCKAPPWIRPVLWGDGTCHDSCENPNEYVTSTGECAPCDDSCATCNGPGPQACSSCDLGGEASLMLNGRCVGKGGVCPSGLADENGICLPCHPSCSSCDAPGDAGACTSCSLPGQYLPAGSAPGTCAEACPKGEFPPPGLAVVPLWSRRTTAALAQRGMDELESWGRCAPCPSGCSRCEMPVSYDDGAGLNLQHGCHHVVLFAPLAQAAKDSEKIIAAVGKEQQSIGRVRRAGQSHKVTVHRLVLEGPNGERTVDGALHERNEDKELIRSATNTADA